MNLEFIKLWEPEILKKMMISFNDLVNKNDILVKMIPFTADIFVFTYPIYLTSLYLYWIWKKDTFYKEAALYIFFAWISSVLINVFIQMFIDKDRPEIALESKDKLILSHIPDAPFPSDHATMSAAIAMSVLLLWIKHKSKWFMVAWWVFWLFSIVMSISRVWAWVHWVTDVVAWTLIWVIVALLFFHKKIHGFMCRTVYKFIIDIEKVIFEKVFKIKQ